MSNQYIKPIHDIIGDYKITDPVFDDNVLDTTIDQLTVDVQSLCASAEYAVSSVDKLQLSVDGLALSISNAIQRLDWHDDDIQYLSSVLSNLNLRALKHAITDVGILRPSDAHELYLKIDVFDSAEMSANLGTIDLSNSNDWKYFKALLVNNGENSADASLDPLRPEYFPGTQWINPTEIDEAIKEYGTSSGFTGYGPAFNNSPVNVSFLAWLEDNDMSKDLNQQSRFYLRFVWYYLDLLDNTGEAHFSDHFSMVVPSYAEVGAKAGSSVTKSELYDIKQALETQVATIHYISEEEIEELGHSEYSDPGYYVQPYQCSVLDEFGSNVKKIILQSYSDGKPYKLKFTTGNAAVSIGNGRASSTKIVFNADYGNGPEALDELNSSPTVFQANTTYLVALNLGMIQVIAQA